MKQCWQKQDREEIYSRLKAVESKSVISKINKMGTFSVLPDYGKSRVFPFDKEYKYLESKVCKSLLYFFCCLCQDDDKVLNSSGKTEKSGLFSLAIQLCCPSKANFKMSNFIQFWACDKLLFFFSISVSLDCSRSLWFPKTRFCFWLTSANLNGRHSIRLQ